MKAMKEIKGTELRKVNGGGAGDLESGLHKALSYPTPTVEKRNPFTDAFQIKDRIFGV